MTDTRLDRMLPFLTPKERAIMTLRDFKADKPQDQALLNSTTDRDAAAFNGYVGKMNAANGDLAHLILVIYERVRQEELRLGWLRWATFTGLEMWAVRAAFAMSAREPITKSQYEVKLAEARAEPIPIDECAMLYTEDHHTWDDADYETDDDGNQHPTDEAWYRVRDAKLDELRTAIAAGTLKATGKGKRAKVEAGAFYDSIGAPVAVPPDLGIEYDVRPDDRWREVEFERKEQAFISKVLDRGASKLDLPLDMESPLVLENDVVGFDVQTARLCAVQLRAGIAENWRELRAIECEVDAFTEDFDGEDVLMPSVRERLDEAKKMLLELHEEAQRYTGPFELPEPDEELRGTIERIADREMRHVPMR